MTAAQDRSFVDSDADRVLFEVIEERVFPSIYVTIMAECGVS